MSQPVAFVTGCSSGIGRALADAFQRAGYRVWASARKEDDVRALAEAGFQAVQLDVNDAAALARLAEELGVEAAGLDVLVNNAGYGAMGPLLDGGVEAMRRQGPAAIADAHQRRARTALHGGEQLAGEVFGGRGIVLGCRG
ncbi:SDR family NAD(P)-dependent oxidoreductase, partial [Pseudomonas aeruginosa]|uniref:SDR family NAD(P)-dependent oxidoreductase n=1 Tax=Pseudomonas aeruginosa TaxID=287 RepID=UPI002095F8A5